MNQEDIKAERRYNPEELTCGRCGKLVGREYNMFENEFVPYCAECSEIKSKE